MPSRYSNCLIQVPGKCFACQPHYVLDKNSQCVRSPAGVDSSVPEHRIRHTALFSALGNIELFRHLLLPKQKNSKRSARRAAMTSTIG